MQSQELLQFSKAVEDKNIFFIFLQKSLTWLENSYTRTWLSLTAYFGISIVLN